MPPLHAPNRCYYAAYLRERRFYRRYHTHPVNVLLHAATVPVEWFSTFVFVAAGLSAPWAAQALGVALAGYHVVCLGIRGPTLAAAAGLAGLAFAASAALTQQHLPPGAAAGTAVAVAGHAAAWVLQVGVGHHLVERNQPAMATQLTAHSVVVSLLLAWDWEHDKDDDDKDGTDVK
jgi:hypothetical protein